MTHKHTPIFCLSEKLTFPPPHLARKDGLLAVGGDLSEERLLLAYRMGIFPWYSDNEPIIWWSPDPRFVLYPKEIHVSKRLKRTVRQGLFRVTADTAFRDVITSCAQVRLEEDKGTWIVDEMIEAYCRLHESGYAHSVETWYDGELVGGLYGVSLGKSFFGESMFSRVSDASKAAFVRLAEYLDALSFDMIDCQMKTRHLMRFGAREVPRKQFLAQLQTSLLSPTKRGKWDLDEESACSSM